MAFIAELAAVFALIWAIGAGYNLYKGRDLGAALHIGAVAGIAGMLIYFVTLVVIDMFNILPEG